MQYKSCSHVFHFIMCLLTGFIWGVIWIACAASVARHNRRVDASQRNEQIELLRRIANGQETEQLIKQIKGVDRGRSD